MSSDEGQRGLNKTAWESAAYIVDPYLGLARAQGGGARKAGEDPRLGSGSTEATLLPKKARKATRPTTCQVDGCGRDLVGEKAYLQRYSVCEQHFKADLAVVQGQEVRFCQQCNKFQDLREFEGARRSCAARSKDRNLRRRLQTTLQKGNSGEELMMPSTLMNPHQQQSGSLGRSGPMAGGGGSDDSGGGGGAGSGEVSMGGSAAVVRRPGAGSGGSDYSLDARGAAAMTAAMDSLRAAHAASGGVQSRHQTLPAHQQPTGSGGNGGGASSGNMDAAGHEGQGRDHRASAGAPGGWFTVEQVAQSYEPEAGLAAGLTATLNRRTNAGPGSGGDVGSMLMDIDHFLAASSNPYATHQSRYNQHLAGSSQTPLTLDGGGGAGLREQDLPYARKLAATISGGGGGGGALGWGGPASLSMLEAFDSLRHPQQASHQSQQQQQQQQQSHLALRPIGLQLQQSQSALTAGWLVGAAQRQQHEQGTRYPVGEGGLGGQQQQPQPTLAGGGGEGSAAELLGQLQGAVAVVDRGGMAAAAKDDMSLTGLLGGSRTGASPAGAALGHGRGSGPGVHGDQLEGPRSTANATRGLLQQQQQQSQSLPLSSLLSAPASHQRDDLSAMIKERRAALIRQQLLQQQHRQQQLQQQLPLLHQQQQQDLLMQQEQLALLGAYGEGAFIGLTPAEQLQLRLLAAGASGGSGTAGLEDFCDVGPGAGSSLSMDVGLGGLGGAKLGASAAASGGSSALAVAETLGMGRVQPSVDPNLDAIHLLEHYARGGGGGGAAGHVEGGAGDGVGFGHLTLSGGGRGPLGSGAPTNTVGGVGGSGDGLGRYSSGDGGGGPGLPGHGHGDRGSGGSGGGSARLLTGLFPGAGRRDDALAARVCLKLFSCMPEDLPTDMLLRLRRWAVTAESDVMQIFMRPGCVHIIANVRHNGGGQAALERSVLGGGDLRTAVAALRGAFDSSGLLRGRRVVVQASDGPRGAFEYDDTAGGRARWVAEAVLARAPSVVSMLPAAVPCGTATIAVVSGRNLLKPGTRFFARCGGRSYELKPLMPQPSSAVLAAAVAAGLAPPARQAPASAAGAALEVEVPVLGDASSGPDSPIAPGNMDSLPSWLSSPTSFAPGACSSLYESDQCLNSWASPEPDSTPERCRTPSLPSEGEASDSRCELTGQPRLLQSTALAGGLYLESVFMHMPALPRHGLIAVEATHPDVDVMGGWAAGVACQDSATVAELHGWLRRSTDIQSGRWLLLELGVLLDYDSMMPSLLQEPTPTSASNGPGGVAARRGDAGVAGLGTGQQADTGGGAGPAVSARSHQRAPQQKQQQQHGQQPRVMPVASNPLPRLVERGSDQDGLAAAAAAAGSGALSAVAYTSGEAPPQPSILSARPDGSLELRLLPSSAAGARGSTVGAVAASLPRNEVPAPFAAVGGLARRLYGESSAGSGAGIPYAGMGMPASSRVDPVTLSDDTKVPDAAGRMHEPSLRRLLAHPLLHPGCRRAMEGAAARLLAYAVASGLPLLATGLLEWLMAMQAPSLGINTAAAATTGNAEEDAITVADVFARVASRAAAATARAAAAAAAITADRCNDYSGHTGVGTHTFGLSDQSDSSRGSSVDSFGGDGLRSLAVGFSLLHLAAMSGRSAMVLQVLDWADAYGRPWLLDEHAGPGRVTALHLAAALRDGGEVARLLLSLGPAGQDAWLLVRDAVGRTPADIAGAAGLQHLNHFCLYGEDPASTPLPANELGGRVSTCDRSIACDGAAAAGVAGADSTALGGEAEAAVRNRGALIRRLGGLAQLGWPLLYIALVVLLLAAVLGALLSRPQGS